MPGASYTYDPNGNLAQKTEGSDNWVYSWNAESQLTKVEKNGAEIARFAYDPKRRRLEKGIRRPVAPADERPAEAPWHHLRRDTRLPERT